MTKDEICGLLRQIHDVLAMQSETNQVKPVAFCDGMPAYEGPLSKSQSKLLVQKLDDSPKSEWAGLTDEELKPLCDEWRIIYGGHVCAFAKAIEVKLRSKNAWIRLTDKEIEECWDGDLSPYQMQCIREIEAKLKEKNA